MVNELKVITADVLVGVGEQEVNQLIKEIVDTSKKNMEDICDLTLECTTLLTAAEGRETALKSQGPFKRFLGNITGKNQKIRDAILSNNTNALYAAQGIINRVMQESLNNRKLMIAINDRLSDLYIELKEGQNEQLWMIAEVRKAVVAFYSQYKEKLLEQDRRITEVEEFAKERCPRCHKEMMAWQRVCPQCGAIHRLKTGQLSSEAMEVLKKLLQATRRKV